MSLIPPVRIKMRPWVKMQVHAMWRFVFSPAKTVISFLAYCLGRLWRRSRSKKYPDRRRERKRLPVNQVNSKFDTGCLDTDIEAFQEAMVNFHRGKNRTLEELAEKLANKSSTYRHSMTLLTLKTYPIDEISTHQLHKFRPTFV